MTSQFITLLTASARTATLLIASNRFLFARDSALDWRLSMSDGPVVATGRLHSVVLNLGNLEPESLYRLETAVGALTFATATETALLDIRDFGASTGSADNAQAIQSAIIATPAGGTLRLPAGSWSSGPVFLKSDMTLLIEEDAILADSGSRQSRTILPARHADGRVLGTWEGVAEPCFASLINAIDCENLTITGQGTVDGGGDRGDWWTWPKETRDGARRPRTIFLSGCRHVTMSGITVRNSPSWTIHPVLCEQLLAAGLTILNDPLSPNTDGLNPEASSDIRLIGLDISVGDDCIAIKAGKRDPHGGPDRPTRRVEIRNCLMQRGHGAVVMGSEMSRGIHDVSISRCHFVGTDRGLRIKTRRGRGGAVSDIHLSHCRMDGVATPIAVNAFYFCDADGRSDYVQSRKPLPLSIETPRISNITIRDVVVSGAETAAAVFYGLPESEIEAVSVDGLSVAYAEGAKPGHPEMACHLPQLLHAGIIAENTRFSLLARLSPQSIHPNLGRSMLTSYFDNYARDYDYYKGGAWCYEDGCLYRGLISLHEATGETRWLDHLTRLVDGQIGPDGALAGYRIDEFNIDNVLAGRALIYLHSLTGEARYLEAARPLGLQLQHHPRTKAGPYWHKLRYPHQIWLDGLYMALPFKLELANALAATDMTSDMASDAIDQFRTALDLTFDKTSGLYRHGYDEARLQAWADDRTGQSAAHWARSVGWLAMAFVDVIDNLPNGPDRDDLAIRLAALNKQLETCATSDYRWLQVIDHPEIAGNYPESSATAMFAYALQKAERLGIGANADLGRKALHALVEHELRAGIDGRVQLNGICCVAGLGPFQGIYRDGSVAYYLTEELRAEDIKGVAPLMMAYAEERRYKLDAKPAPVSLPGMERIGSDG